MKILHLTASTFLGGPERQMLNLARALPGGCRSAFASFREGGACLPFVQEARRLGFAAHELAHDTPHGLRMAGEVGRLIRQHAVEVVFCHGYKADLLGRLAAWKQGVPAVAVSRGWTAEDRRVRLYEALDRVVLRLMDHVVCVSDGQARRVSRAGVAPFRISVIRNAIRCDRFGGTSAEGRGRLLAHFGTPRQKLVCAAGRLSPEKGFDVLIRAAARVVREEAGVGFVVFGEGALRESLERAIRSHGLEGAFVLGGFRPDLDRLLPAADLLALPSHTEGLPNVILEAFAGGVPVVATRVGGNPEVVEDGVSGYLVPPGDADALAGRIRDVLSCEEQRARMGRAGQRRVREEFTFEEQARQYQRLIARLRGRRAVRLCSDMAEIRDLVSTSIGASR